MASSRAAETGDVRVADASGADILSAVPLLAALPLNLRERLVADAREVHLRAGEWLFHEGAPAESAYVVRSGRLEVVAAGPPPAVIRVLKRGAMLGELALLRAEVRSASVRARRDSDLIELSRAQFEGLIRDAPDFALALTRIMGAQLAANRAPAQAPVLPRTLAVVALDDGAPGRLVADRLALELARFGTVAELRLDGERPVSELLAALDAAERDHDRVLLDGGSLVTGGAWTDFCVREADMMVAVSSGGALEACRGRGATLHGCELLVQGTAPDLRTVADIAPRELQVVRSDDALRAAVAATARRLTGTAVGLVLSGGGARALTHLGVLEELRASGVVIDRIAGVSMGAVVAGLAAMGLASEDVHATLRYLFVENNPTNDFTFPMFALIRGRKTRRLVDELFGGVAIEELPLRFFCVSCDLVGRQLVVHRRGSLADAIYSSLAIPGVFPPVADGANRLLVDGGVLDNLPVATMAINGEGPVIAVDASHRADQPHHPVRPRLERLMRPLRRALTGSELAVPRLSETLLRTLTLGSADTVSAAMRHADLVISPPVEAVGLLEWGQLSRMREIGRLAARAALSQDLLAAWTNEKSL